MTGTPARIVALLAAAGLSATLVACSSETEGTGAETSITPTTGVATTAEETDPSFEVSHVDPVVTKEIKGEPVEDPAQPITYHWQGTTRAPNGGSIVTIAVTNTGESPMLPEALGTPELRFKRGANSELETATPKTKDEAGMDSEIGLDMQLGAGATTNVHYAFDVTTSNLWNAEFTIGNVTFSGNLNN